VVNYSGAALTKTNLQGTTDMADIMAFTSITSGRGRDLLNVLRRQSWFTDGLTPAKAHNLLLAVSSWVGKTEDVHGLPPTIKIDISPVCNLSCTVCVHAQPHDRPELLSQRFEASHRMTMGQFKSLISQVEGVACAVTLHYLGDPLTHPDLDQMCRVARDAHLNVHWSSNFSFKLTDERIRNILTSGVSHLTACVDGFSQETYERSRVGGRLSLVLSNLERLCRFKKQLGLTYPKIEVQYLCYRHNLAERASAQAFFDDVGVDLVTYAWGDVTNYVDLARNDTLGPLGPSALPKCTWPYLSLVVKYNGDVIPCCVHRLGPQYAEGGEPRAIGNVFASSLSEVWRSQGYRRARRMVSSPEGASEPGAREHFCHGCVRIYETTDNWRSGADGDLPQRSPRQSRRLPVLDRGS
jgi:MoaA/NifB/PqqE/SkfB family radical SAM enzyme